MFGIAGTVELGTICPGTGTWNRLQDGTAGEGQQMDLTHAICLLSASNVLFSLIRAPLTTGFPLNSR